MKKYLTFQTEEEAIAREAEISSVKGYPSYGENGLTHKVVEGVGCTERWDTPRQTATGLWVIASPDDTGVEWQSEWNFPEEE
jgi:hypothetical protein